MTAKYKVHELAKDLDVKSNVIIDLLKPFDETPKKSHSSFTTDELDILFDRLTKENEVENFNAYFSMKKPEPQAEKKAEESDTKIVKK